MNEKEKSPDVEIEALRKLKRLLFVQIWCCENLPELRDRFDVLFVLACNADLLEEYVEFANQADEFTSKGPYTDEAFDAFLKEYFGA